MPRWLTALLLTGLFFATLHAQEKESELKLSEDEKAILKLLNDEREKEKLPPLKPNAILFKVARAHSANMAKQEKMAHVLDGKKPSQRVEEAGYDYRVVGENLAFGENDGEPVPLADIHD